MFLKVAFGVMFDFFVFCCAIFVTKDFYINTLFCTSLNFLYDGGSMKYLFLLVMHYNTFHIHFCKTFVCLNFSTFGFVEISCEKWKV